MDVEANSGAEESGPSLLNVVLQMRSLEAVQLDLNTVNTQADRALQQLEHGQSISTIWSTATTASRASQASGSPPFKTTHSCSK